MRPIQLPQTHSQRKVTLCVGVCFFIQVERKSSLSCAFVSCHECMHVLYVLACGCLSIYACKMPRRAGPSSLSCVPALIRPIPVRARAHSAHHFSKEHKSNPMFHLCVCHLVPLRGNLAILTSPFACGVSSPIHPQKGASR